MEPSAQRPLVAVAGPTGVGKTALAVMLAARLPVQVISVDSRQVYRYMDIGTAKPGPEVRAQAPHHLIDVIDPDETYSAGRFAREAPEAAGRIREAGGVPLLVGGTGLYLRALRDGLHAAPSDPAVRADLHREAADRGPEALHAGLAALDPETAGSIHPRDLVRTVRALEIHRLTGETVSALRLHRRSGSPVRVFALRLERERLCRAIEGRVDRMFREGFVDEVRRLLDLGYHEGLRSMHGIGYREIALLLRGERTLEETTAAIKKATRDFARRQMTWFRKMPAVEWIDLPPEGGPGEAAALALERALREAEET